MGKRLVHIDGGVIFSNHLSPMINNYIDILVIVHQLDVHGLGSVDEFFFSFFTLLATRSLSQINARKKLLHYKFKSQNSLYSLREDDGMLKC